MLAFNFRRDLSEYKIIINDGCLHSGYVHTINEIDTNQEMLALADRTLINSTALSLHRTQIQILKSAPLRNWLDATNSSLAVRTWNTRVIYNGLSFFFRWVFLFKQRYFGREKKLIHLFVSECNQHVIQTFNGSVRWK